MKHEQAFALVAEHAPSHAGEIWDTSYHTGCDTAHAVADQYETDETAEAIAALRSLSRGETPEGWERHHA